MRYLIIIACCSAAYGAQAGPVSSFADIEFWVGSGSNEAAMVIDWVESSTADESPVWGYRWDGDAYGEDMMMAIVEADPRLFIKIHDWGGNLGISLYGMGYDADDDGYFALDDGTAFDSNGIAVVPGPADGGAAVDTGDVYAEGWFTGYWNYGLSDGNPYDGGSWSHTQLGMTSQPLADGDWNSWAYTPSFNFEAFAENPVAAMPSGNADFDADGDVDGRDFLTWQRGHSIASGATLSDGDANGDGAVDQLDLSFWSTQFSSGGSGGAALAVPEPSCSVLALWLFSVSFLGSRHRKRSSIS